MEFENIQNLSAMNGELKEYLQHEAKLYNVSGWIMAVVTVILLFVFPLGGVAFAFGTLYLFYSARKNKKGSGVLFTGRIRKKERFVRITYREEDARSQTESNTMKTFFRSFRMDLEKSLDLGSQKVTRLTGNSYRNKEVVVNEALFEAFKEGDEFAYVLSPADDLIAYVIGDTLHSLLKTETISDGNEKKVSFAISQEKRRPGDNWRPA